MAREDLPALLFYVGDWRRDIGVQSLSYYHRGIWLELLMHMHCSEDRGRLVLNGKPMTNPHLARLLGLSERESADAISVLLDAGVPSRDESGALFCRRMVKDEQIRKVRSAAGQRGGSSKSQANGQAKPKQNPDNDIGIENGFEDWLKELSSESHYSHVQVMDEWGKMLRWCEVNRRQPTRRRFVNWLNRIERPLTAGDRPPANDLSRTKPMSAFEIKTRLDAIEDRLGQTQWKKDDPAIAEERRRLTQRKKELQAKLRE